MYQQVLNMQIQPTKIELNVAIIFQDRGNTLGQNKFASSLMLDESFVSDHFVDILTDDQCLDSQVNIEKLRQKYSEYAHIFQFIHKLQIVFNAHVNVSIIKLKPENQNSQEAKQEEPSDYAGKILESMLADSFSKLEQEFKDERNENIVLKEIKEYTQKKLNAVNRERISAIVEEI